MASPTQWTWVWVNSRSCWWTLACCSPWGLKVSDMTEWLNWTELNEENKNYTYTYQYCGLFLNVYFNNYTYMHSNIHLNLCIWYKYIMFTLKSYTFTSYVHHMYIHMYIHIHTFTHIMCTCICTHTCTYIHICTCIYTHHICTCTHIIYTYICTDIIHTCVIFTSYVNIYLHQM